MAEAAEKTETEKKESGVDVEKLIADLDSNMQKKLDGQVSRLAETIKAKGDEADEESEDWSESDDDDAYVTKKDVDKLLAKVERVAETKARKATSETLNENSAQAARDAQALRDFPYLDQNSPHYDPKFVVAVEKQVESKMKRGRGSDPDLLYDSAAVVKATNAKWSRPLKEQAEEETRKYNNRFDSFSSRGKSHTDSLKANEKELEMAGRLGMSKERLEEIWKKHGKTGVNK